MQRVIHIQSGGVGMKGEKPVHYDGSENNPSFSKAVFAFIVAFGDLGQIPYFPYQNDKKGCLVQ
jgi:hypothetical protein